MPAVVASNAAPSTLADVIGQVVDAFGAMADATPIMVGSQYLEHFGNGSAPRVLFVHEPRGKWGAPIEMGNACSVTHSCDVYVRADPTGGDVDRLDKACALADLVMDLLVTAATGRIGGGEYADDSETGVDAYGADLAFSFTYQRDVRHNPTRWGLAAATADTSGALPLPPPGQPATSVEIALTVEPQIPTST